MLRESFISIIDPRQQGKVKHNLPEIVVMTICAVMAGCDVRLTVTVNGVRTTDERYYITSLTSVETFSKAVRAHWGIENTLHWCLDMTFHEDYSRIRKDHSAENMAVVRHIALIS